MDKDKDKDKEVIDITETGWPQWRTSTFSAEIECVSVANLDGMVGIRNTKDPTGVAVIIPRHSFGALIDEIKAGGLDYLAP